MCERQRAEGEARCTAREHNRCPSGAGRRVPVVSILERAREHLCVGSQRRRRSPHELHVLALHANVVVDVVDPPEEQRLVPDCRGQQRRLCAGMTEWVDLRGGSKRYVRQMECGESENEKRKNNCTEAHLWRRAAH